MHPYKREFDDTRKNLAQDVISLTESRDECLRMSKKFYKKGKMKSANYQHDLALALTLRIAMKFEELTEEHHRRGEF